jgi:hypothetical protein
MATQLERFTEAAAKLGGALARLAVPVGNTPSLNAADPTQAGAFTISGAGFGLVDATTLNIIGDSVVIDVA